MSPVRNISAIGGTKPIPIYHAIPPPSSAIAKVTVDNGTSELDITDLITSAKFNGGTTKTIGNFELKFMDPDKTYYDQISNFNDVYLYGNYGTTASTKRLRFKVESKGYEDHQTKISGLGILMICAGKKIIYKTTSGGVLTTKAKSTIITEILQNNFSDITDFSQIETNSAAVQKNYSEIPFMDVINDICGSTHEFYLDADLVPHYFTRGSIQSSTEGVSEEVNFLYNDDNATNAEEIYSRVRVYGGTIGGIQIIATSDEDTSLTGGIKKDKIISNTSITTTTQAQDLADVEFAAIKNPTRIGAFSSFFLPSLNPGEKLFIALPQEDVSPGYYQVQEFTHEFDLAIPNGFKTKVIMEKRRINLPKIVNENISFQSESTDSNNPNDLNFSYIFSLSSSSGTFTNTVLQINTATGEGELKTDGSSSGTWISDEIDLDSDLTAIQPKINGYNLSGVQLSISTNGGSTYTPIVSGTISIPSGKKIKFKVTINSANTVITGVGFLYNL